MSCIFFADLKSYHVAFEIHIKTDIQIKFELQFGHA